LTQQKKIQRQERIISTMRRSPSLVRTSSFSDGKSLSLGYFEGALFAQMDTEEKDNDAKHWNSTIVSPLLTKIALLPFYLSSESNTEKELKQLLNIDKDVTFSSYMHHVNQLMELQREDESEIHFDLKFIVNEANVKTVKEYERFMEQSFAMDCIKIDFIKNKETGMEEHKELLLRHDLYHRIASSSLECSALCTSFHMNSLEWDIKTKFLPKNTIQNYKFINVFSEDKKAALCTVEMMQRKEAKEIYGEHKWPTKNTTGFVHFNSLTMALRPGDLRITFILPEGASKNLYKDIVDSFEMFNFMDHDLMTKIMSESKQRTLDVLIPKCTIREEHVLDLHELHMMRTNSIMDYNQKSHCTGLTDNDQFHLNFFTQMISTLHMDEIGVHGERTVLESTESSPSKSNTPSTPSSTGTPSTPTKEDSPAAISSGSGGGLFKKKKVEFILNRPFFFILSHTDGSIFLMGRVNKP
jgi:hypothetical protein